jgi:hypothetical protein
MQTCEHHIVVARAIPIVAGVVVLIARALQFTHWNPLAMIHSAQAIFECLNWIVQSVGYLPTTLTTESSGPLHAGAPSCFS